MKAASKPAKVTRMTAERSEAMTLALATPEEVSAHRRAKDMDRHVAARLRERRIMLGVTQHELAEAVGVQSQMIAKYENGRSRIAAARLYVIARTLGLADPAWFFQDHAPPQLDDRWFRLARDFLALSGQHQEGVLGLARALAEGEECRR